MDLSRFHPETYSYWTHEIFFDFDIKEYRWKQQNTFPHIRSLTSYLDNNPWKVIYFTLDQVVEFQEDGEKLFINYERFEEYCNTISKQWTNKIQWFFTRQVRNYNEAETREIKLSASEDEILEVVKNFTPKWKQDFVRKVKEINDIDFPKNWEERELTEAEFIVGFWKFIKTNQWILRILSNITPEEIEKIANLVWIENMKKILDIWSGNKANTSEEFWQKLFQDNGWIISQIFSCPFTHIWSKMYCWWKTDENSGWVLWDLLYQNICTNNVAFIEIKTPKKPIIGNEYRWSEDGLENKIFSMSFDVSWGINQVLNQRKNYIQTHWEKQTGKKDLYNSKCILILWNTEDLSWDEKKSFELFRSTSKEVEIITFDELFGRISALYKLFQQYE